MLCQLSYGGKRRFYFTEIPSGNEIGALPAHFGRLLVAPQCPALHLKFHQFAVELVEKFRVGVRIQALQLSQFFGLQMGHLQLEEPVQDVPAVHKQRIGIPGRQGRHRQLADEAAQGVGQFLAHPLHPGGRDRSGVARGTDGVVDGYVRRNSKPRRLEPLPLPGIKQPRLLQGNFQRLALHPGRRVVRIGTAEGRGGLGHRFLPGL